MKLNVSLSIYNGNGSCASIESKDDHSFRLAEGYSLSAKAACRKAAKDLRDAAARFDLLADEKDPYHRLTHQKINLKAVA